MNPLATGIKSGVSSLIAALFGKDNRIARRLIVLIIAFSSLITLLISIMQLTLEYRELRSEVDQQFDAIKVFLPNLTAAVWDFDETQVRLALAALIQQPHIEYANVTASGNSQSWTAGTADMRNAATRSYPLLHLRQGTGSEIGRLEVAAGLSQIYRRVMKRALSIVFSNAVKTFMVALFTVYLFRQLVTRRLERLAVRVGKLVPEPLALPDAAQGGSGAMPRGLDELESVEWVLQDTTGKLHAASAALNNLNRRLLEQIAENEALLHNALVGIVMVRGDAIVASNRRFEDMFGFAPGSAGGQSVRTLFSNEQEWLAVDAAVRDGRSLGKAATAAMLKHDGSGFWAEIAGCVVAPERARGDAILVFSDITGRKSMEEEMVRLRAELWKMLQSQLVRHAVAGMAHEVNQPLASIAALCEASQRKLACYGGELKADASERLKHMLGRMASESERAGGIVRRMVATLHTPTVEVEPTALAPALAEAARVAPASGYADCDILIDCPDAIGPVLANRQQLEQVLLNLIGNATEAMRAAGLAKGRIWISAAEGDDGAAAQVTVRDEGPGVSRDMEAQIFHPFISTKPGNLGMGLTISRSLIEALGGRFWLAASDQPGATFHFTLPFASSP